MSEVSYRTGKCRIVTQRPKTGARSSGAARDTFSILGSILETPLGADGSRMPAQRIVAFFTANRSVRTLSVLFGVLAFLWILPAGASEPTVESVLAQGLQRGLAGSALSLRLELANPKEVERFYRSRNFRPAWVGAGQPLPRASTLIDALRHASAEGLQPQDFHLAAIERLRDARAPAQLADLDLLLTDSWCRYAVELNSGRAGLREADPHWHIARKPIDPVARLQDALAAPAFAQALQALEPPHAAYRRLRGALVHYREITAQGGWPVIPEGPSMKPGQRDPRIPLLRRRLRITGDLNASADSGARTLDAGLEQAVRHFQRRDGLEVDGIVGPKTRAALNVPVAARIDQLRVNMERWRWLPPELGPRYIMVNSAAFDVHVVEAGKPVMAMKAVIGRATRQTPSLRSAVDTVVINPYWNVPASIARRELLPKEQANPDYFRQHDIRVFRGSGPDAVEVDPASVDWDKLSADDFPYRLRQDPGPGNSLGRVKLLFPNPYHVYLHDTPARDLFECSIRTFSHGCVRLEHAVDLAAYVLRDTDDWSEARLREAIEAGATTPVKVADPVPIYLVYLTAWVDADGTVHFRHDVYGRDAALLQAGL